MPEELDPIVELLPFYVSGSLTDAETARVEAAVEGSDALQTEVAFLRAVRAGVKEHGQGQSQSPGALGEKRLLRSIRKEQRRATRQRVLVPALAIAAGLALLAQSLVIGSLMGRDEESLQTLGQSRGVLQIRFAHEATELEIRELLLDKALVIVDGPSALGIYRLGVEELGDSDPERLAAILAELATESEIVEHVALESGAR